MSGIGKILAAICFSVMATVIPLWVISRQPGLEIPRPYWIFAFVCPATLSAAISILLVRQGNQLASLNAQLQAAHDSMATLAQTDPLTGVLNRNAFLRCVEDASVAEPGWLLLLDVDHFKVVNDRHGHEAGDRVLCALTQAVSDIIGEAGALGRLGGEEFAIFLPGAEQSFAGKVAEAIRDRVSSTHVPDHRGQSITVTCSIGLAPLPASDVLAHSLRTADAAMYRAKHEGRNRVRIAA